MKVAIVMYEDGDPDNEHGPVSSEIFRDCWALRGRPKDFFSLNNWNEVMGGPYEDTYICQRCGASYPKSRARGMLGQAVPCTCGGFLAKSDSIGG